MWCQMLTELIIRKRKIKMKKLVKNSPIGLRDGLDELKEGVLKLRNLVMGLT